MKKEKKILFIIPPFTSLQNPYPAIPILARYLNDKNINCSVLDINSIFWEEFLTEENYKKGLKYIKDRFLELNSQTKLNFKNMVEYFRIAKFLNVPTLENYKLAPKDLKINVSCAPFFPNIFINNPIKKFCNYFNEFSSDDIISSTKYNFFYSDIIKNIIKKNINRQPLVVAISLVFNIQLFPAFYIAKVIKEICPQSHVTIGGPFISIHFREIKNKKIFEIVDSFIIDEGEIPLETLYKKVLNNEKDLSDVPNLIWMKKNEIKYNYTIPALPLRKLDNPNFDILPIEKYKKNLFGREVIFSLRLSKGCFWQKCSFCRTDMYFCKDYYQPEFDSVFDVIYETYKKYNVKYFLFSDEAVHPDLLKYISEKIIKYKLKFRWITHTRFHPKLNRKLFQLMKEANCDYLTLGLESYNDRLLKLMKKGISKALVDKVIAENNGILPLKLYMILGFPTETKEEAIESYKYVMKLKKDNKVIGNVYSLFHMVYGCDIWKNPENYSIEKINIPPECDLYPDICDFECSKGMSRKEVNELFSKLFSEKYSANEIQNVNINGNPINVNFSTKLINKIMVRNLATYYFLPYGKWLESTEETIKR